jgi:hypothetical protein
MQLQRWHEHFNETLNFGHAHSVESPKETTSARSINSSPPSISEIRNAIKVTKRGKAPVIDIKAQEMLKANLLFPIFKIIWEQERHPDDWL